MIVYQSYGETYARLSQRERATLRAAHRILERLREVQESEPDSDLVRAETALYEINQVLYGYDGCTENL